MDANATTAAIGLVVLLCMAGLVFLQRVVAVGRLKAGYAIAPATVLLHGLAWASVMLYYQVRSPGASTVLTAWGLIVELHSLGTVVTILLIEWMRGRWGRQK